MAKTIRCVTIAYTQAGFKAENLVLERPEGLDWRFRYLAVTPVPGPDGGGRLAVTALYERKEKPPAAEVTFVDNGASDDEADDGDDDAN